MELLNVTHDGEMRDWNYGVFSCVKEEFYTVSQIHFTNKNGKTKTTKLSTNLSKIGIPNNYSDKVSEFINEYRDKFQDSRYVLWILLECGFFTDQELQAYSLWLVKQIKHFFEDDIFIDTINLAEKIFKGEKILYKVGYDLYLKSQHEAIKRKGLFVFIPSSLLHQGYITNKPLHIIDLIKSSNLVDDLYNVSINKLLDFFITKENNQEFVWGI